MSRVTEHILEAKRITPPGGHFFFAYYDKLQFSPDDRYVLAQRALFDDRPPRPDDVLEVGMVDLQEENRWISLGTTTAWCWQQGCMLQWLPGPGNRVIYNTRENGQYRSVIIDEAGAVLQRLPRAIYAVSPDGREAICNDFARTGHTRPGYGYVGIPDPNREVPAPEDSGLWRMDLETGECRMIASLAQIAALDTAPPMTDQLNWFNHILYRPDGERIIFLHRWLSPRMTRMYTSRPDGADIHRVSDCANPSSWHASHFWWRDNRTILVWGGALTPDGVGGYRLVKDQTGEERLLNPALLNEDGHMSCPPGDASRWILSDTYPDRETNLRQLFLYDEPADRQIVIGRYDAGAFNCTDPSLVECRCDLHPRWSRRGDLITIDSVHEGFRGVYLLDVADVLENR